MEAAQFSFLPNNTEAKVRLNLYYVFILAGSDKENDSAANSRGNSPKKPFGNLNGLSHKLNGIESNIQQLRDLLMCTGDANGCYVHGKVIIFTHKLIYNHTLILKFHLNPLGRLSVKQ